MFRLRWTEPLSLLDRVREDIEQRCHAAGWWYAVGNPTLGGLCVAFAVQLMQEDLTDG